MNSSLKTVILLLSVFLTSSCSKKNTGSLQQNPPADAPVKDSKMIEATVVDYSNLDGCRFLLELPGGEKLQSENLTPEFEKDKMKVMIKYHVTNKPNICMAGKTIYLDFIKAKKE
jgi:hypothetical protein